MHAGAAAAAAAAPAGAGTWLFSYNKENFQYDAGMRFGRFMMARANANAQVGQYREDIQGITGLTVSKMDAWNTITTCFLAVGAALSCAGRIGMHGSAPPGWFCALFSGCIFMSVMFNGTSLWLAMHASLRAQCAATSLQTRKVRLPIPSMGQIDQARVFGSSFEKQKARDIFRVPFMKHSQDAPDLPTLDPTTVGKKKGVRKPVHDPNKEFGSTARDSVPSWVRDEVVVDKGEGYMGLVNKPQHETGEVPDHFKQLMKAQEEWRNYDVYARICMLYGVCSFLYAVTYYAMGTAISELRGFWAMWSLPVVFMTAQALILRIDILRDGQHRLPNAEWLGHAAPFFACAACTLEYRFYYSEASVVMSWVLALVALFCHLVMALRMLDLAWPDKSPINDMPEEPGKQWWPGSWKVPRAFSKNLWFITPPTKLEPDVAPCLLHEIEDMANHGGGVVYKKQKPVRVSDEDEVKVKTESNDVEYQSPLSALKRSRAKDLPWRIVKWIIITAVFQWIFIMITTTAEAIMGPESLLKPPGEPPWIRDTKMRHWTSHMVHLSGEELPSHYRLFSASKARSKNKTEDIHEESGGVRRRLDAKDSALAELLKVIPSLEHLTDELKAMAKPERTATDELMPQPPMFMAPVANVARVAWPSLFEPRHLLCGGKADGRVSTAAISPRGFGVRVALAETGNEEVVAEPFALDGLSSPIAGAAFTSSGIKVVTSTGELMHCTVGADSWPCQATEHPPLPSGRGGVLSAAVSHADTAGNLLFAVVHGDLPEVASLYRSVDEAWHPAGEIHIPPTVGNTPSMHFTEGNKELLMSGVNGEVHRRSLGGAPSAFSPTPTGLSAGKREFKSACSLLSGGIVQLSLKQISTPTGLSWIPELLST